MVKALFSRETDTTPLMHKLAKHEQQSWKTFHPIRGMYSPTSSVLIKLYNGIISFHHKLLSSLQSTSRLDDQCQGSHKYGRWDLQARSCWSALQRLWVLLKINLFLVEGHISSRLLLSSLHSLLDTLRYLIACLDLAK